MSQETTSGQHLTYAIVAALIGLSPLGFITGWVAAHHGSQAAEKYKYEEGMRTFSTVVQWIGVGEGAIFGLVLLAGIVGG
ncbi:MAG: hypothetical protein ACKV2Q_14735 [Planctomycetaceae bacterium]